MSAENQEQKKQIVKSVQENNTAQQVLARINQFRENRELKLPANYSPENALKSAWLLLQDVEDRNKNKALVVCKPHSIANALFDMVVQGLNPLKKQCYFIVYGDQLQLRRSYQGAEAVAKRVGNVKEISGIAIYEKDVFEFKIQKNGTKIVTKHEQELENIDHEKVKGAYAVIEYNDGKFDTEIMNIKQIRQAWQQGAAKGNSGAHNNFTDEMAIKTVINRACKKIINSTDDSDLYQGQEDTPDDMITMNVRREIRDNANKVEIGMGEPVQAEIIDPPHPEVYADEPNTSEVTDEPQPAGNGTQMKAPFLQQ